MRGIHWWPVNSHKGSVTRKIFPFDYIIMSHCILMSWRWIIAEPQKYEKHPLKRVGWNYLSNLRSAVVEVPVKFQNDWKKLSTSRLRDLAVRHPSGYLNRGSVGGTVVVTKFDTISSRFLGLSSALPVVSYERRGVSNHAISTVCSTASLG